MFAAPRYRQTSLLSEGTQRHVSVARERTATYSTGQPADAAQALSELNAALDRVAEIDWTREHDAAVRAASVSMQTQVNRLTAEALRPIEQLDRRQAYEHDGAVTAASWLRNRTNMDPAVAARACTAARRLRGLPLLRNAFASGDVSLSHVTAITEAAVPTRFEVISLVEESLVRLATTSKPHALRTAVRAVRDHVDPDGSEPDDQGEPVAAEDDDPRRYWQHSLTIDGLYAGQYLVGGVLGELITTIFDAYSTADPAELPLTSRRSPAQKRVDAMHAALLALCNAGITPTVQGNKAHLLLMVDLLTLMGRDSAAVFASELRRTGRISKATMARLGIDAKVTPVLTMGPYRVVAVGRTYRTLPPWLRPMMEMIHRRCRGPDCDRPACWTEAHHEDGYANGGDTDLNKTIPLCSAHHKLVTYGGWTATMDTATGICTWTAPDGRVISTNPER